MSLYASELFPTALRGVATDRGSFLGEGGKYFGSAAALSDRS
jgi:hypothetical protein